VLIRTTEKEARSVKRALLREMGQAEERTLGDAIDAYELYLRDEKGNKPGSVAETSLKTFFAEPDLPLAGLDRARAARYYEGLTKRTRIIRTADGSKKETPLSVDRSTFAPEVVSPQKRGGLRRTRSTVQRGSADGGTGRGGREATDSLSLRMSWSRQLRTRWRRFRFSSSGLRTVI
jgi:hypothetical protein